MKKAVIKKSEAGFSLIELLIVSVIIVFIIGMIGGIVTGVQRSYSKQRVQTEALNDATAALDMITRLIRMAGNNPNGISGFQGIEVVKSRRTQNSLSSSLFSLIFSVGFFL